MASVGLLWILDVLWLLSVPPLTLCIAPLPVADPCLAVPFSQPLQGWRSWQHCTSLSSGRGKEAETRRCAL